VAGEGLDVGNSAPGLQEAGEEGGTELVRVRTFDPGAVGHALDGDRLPDTIRMDEPRPALRVPLHRFQPSWRRGSVRLGASNAATLNTRKCSTNCRRVALVFFRAPNKTSTPAACVRSLQLRILRLGLLQDGDVGIGVFPERKEVLVCRLAFNRIACHRVGATKLKVR
jgi:hypothetical protein